MRKRFLLAVFSLIALFLSTFIPNKTLAACPNRTAIPIDTQVNAGRVTITLRWDLLSDQEFADSWSDRPALFATIFNPDGQRVDAATTNIVVPTFPEAISFQASGFTPGIIYRIHITDPDNLDANPPKSGSCTFEKNNNPKPEFSVTTADAPPLAEGDDCEANPVGCPNGTYCSHPKFDVSRNKICIKPPTSGEACIPEGQRNDELGLKCVNTVCKEKDDKFICTENVVLKTPCGTKQDGSEGYDNGQCGTVFSGLGVDLPTDPLELIPQILKVILGISGGIVVFLIIRSGYKLMFSQGNPEKVQEAKDELTSAIVGLLFIIFSFVLLQFITNDLLKLEILKKGEGLKTP